MTNPSVGIVAVGRKDGERLMRCLRSPAGAGATIVHVDSASTDGNAARTRNAGLAKLPELQGILRHRRSRRGPSAIVYK